MHGFYSYNVDIIIIEIADALIDVISEEKNLQIINYWNGIIPKRYVWKYKLSRVI